MDVTLTLTTADLELVVEALDCYEYWELGRDLPRNDGTVFIPGDYLGALDRYWTTGPTEEEAWAIAAVRASRQLAARLQRLSQRLDPDWPGELTGQMFEQ